MAAVAAPMYQQHAFIPSSSRATTLLNSAQLQSQQQQEPDLLDEQFTTLFCRALYDYEAQDASALSFRQNDIIEVLTQQPSGWWDGLLGEERGWFPSNYVTVISDEEAELAFSGSEISNLDRQTQAAAAADTSSVLDMSHAMMRGSQTENEDWLDSEVVGMDAGGMEELSNPSLSESNDFWMPEVTSNGQIYYVNTKTGERARDLPHEADEDTSDSDLAGLTSQSSSRSGTSSGLGYGNSLPQGPRDMSSPAGFGLPRRTSTPEPWVKKLADDGMSYYYYNKSDGTVQWTRPEPTYSRDRAPATNSNPTIRPLPPTSRSPPKVSRLSIYSDSSDIQPSDPDPPRQNGHRSPPFQVDVKMELTTAERIAQSLQQAIAPAPAELITDMSALTQGAIQAVVANVQSAAMGRRAPGEDLQMDELVSNVVLTVRNLLYVSAASAGQIPPHVLPRSMRDTKASTATSPLKPAQRKVTATLSRLVLSARALQYDAGSTVTDTLDRIELDAEELERAVLSFVLEVQRLQHPSTSSPKLLKRLHAVFSTANIGLGLVGAGAAGSWKGFGWVSLDEENAPIEALSADVVNDLGAYAQELDRHISLLEQVTAAPNDNAAELIRTYTQNLVTRMSSYLAFATNVHVARHVDIDGIRQSTVPGPNEMYAQTVDRARSLIRTLETAMQSLYDESTSILLTAQSLELGHSSRDLNFDYLNASSTSLKANLGVVNETFEALLAVGHEQADMDQGDYNGSIEWRMSRFSVIDTQLGGSLRPMSTFMDSDPQSDMVGIDMAFELPRKARLPPESFDSTRYPSNGTTTLNDEADDFDDNISPDSSGFRDNDLDPSPLMDDDFNSKKSRPAGNSKLAKLLGSEYANSLPAPPEPEAPPKPWYLQPSYSPTEIQIEPDGSIRGGTVPALVERLTAHEQGDPSFIKTFLMTFKSFTTVDDLFDLLVQRFWIQPPPKLTPAEREDWGKLKQHVIQVRVLNTLKSIVVDDDVLEKDDLFILDRMKEFITTEEVARFPAAKQLLILIERTQKDDGGTIIRTVTAPQGVPPPPIVPKTNKKLKLLDIEPLELARQLTMMESQLYQRIRPMECLQRAREQRTENVDNITVVIQTSNKLAGWVADCILSKEDSRRRAAAMKHLISVADRCRLMNNFSTMSAITAGLNTPPIRRLKRTWEQVNARYMAQFHACEMTILSEKNFKQYRQVMTSVVPPCVPFIGVFLTDLQFVQDGNPDNLPGSLVNFRKRQRASEVINDIKRWQGPYNFHVIPSIQAYIEESLSALSDSREFSERFWNISLEREPREREDEKMARLLQESGFL
ncbi:ras guanine nucleotide exchange factor domain-containing protein [Roridomyces roridus]|uniref:Ras guanine nucleotide exchange factor domain-containing protein n=1 Tax=Roridomyces roridus TaxID=1738132 RepID=A0AAD7CBE0_9AGAR|nr:ras guanine nucleotide exchange factor domain-containing protein [Roridomyces roridus]